MKALSIRSPWWWFILHAGKDIENRDWATKFRGTVYLHAGKWWRPDEVRDDGETAAAITRIFPNEKYKGAEITWAAMKASGGCIVGKVDIIDCVSVSSSPWFFGRYGFVLANPVALDKPIPFKGALGFFDVPDGMVP
jgi:hypothetical protein